MTTPALKRLLYIDVLKIIATFLIIMLHVSALYVRQDAVLAETPTAFAYIINSLTRSALPLFMMISGALLLRDGYRFDLKHRFFLIARNYVIWSAIFVAAEQVMRALSGNDLLPFLTMITYWIRGPYHFWYLQMLLGFYLLMPILEKIKGLQTLSYATFLLFILCYIYSPLSPYLPDCVQTFLAQVVIIPAGYTIFYFLFGASIHRMPKGRKLMAASAAAIVGGIGLRLYQLFWGSATYGEVIGQPLFNYGELLMASGVFYLVFALCKDHPVPERIRRLSNSTLRIYIVSALFIFAYEYLLMDAWDRLVPSPTISILLWSVVVFFCSYWTARLLSLKDRVLRDHRQARGK